MAQFNIKSRVPQPLSSQRGMVLIITLILLFIMTLVMISAMRANISEERMAGNSRDWNTAFQAAESALRDAERDLLTSRISGGTGFATGCSATGLCNVSITGTPVWTTLLASDPGWTTGSSTSSKTVQYGTYDSPAITAIPDVAAQPRYIIEAVPVKTAALKTGFGSTASTDYIYRVTAVGFGANVSSRVVLQGVYRQ